jgi:4-hydroxybenzoyl-CoA reductase subunit beta
MLRLPNFTYHRPKTASEAVAIAATHGQEAMYVAGGTDLYPNMKRRHQTPSHVISLADVAEVHAISVQQDGSVALGAMTRLATLEAHPHLRQHFPAFAHAVAEISTPLLRNMGTIGGNLLLDTRCSYYDQTFEWRESISFCMKKGGDICWVAPGSPRCWAVQSSDTVPVVCAMEAEVELVGKTGVRRIKAGDLYRDDGIQYVTKQPEELLTRLFLPKPGNWKASYVKLRRRGTFDFPVLGVGACLWFDGKKVSKANVRLGGAGSYAIAATETEQLLVGRELTDEVIAAAGSAAMKPARTMDNTDLDVYWRRRVAPVYVARALLGCR